MISASRLRSSIQNINRASANSVKAFLSRKRLSSTKDLGTSAANSLQNEARSDMKSWIPLTNLELQRITTQSLIHEVAEQQRELAAKVVPWFLKNMPASYFRRIPENIRSQHVKAIAAIHDLMHSDLSLKIETKSNDGSHTITYIASQTKSGILYTQIQGLTCPLNCELSSVQVFSSLDGELALNIFTFQTLNAGKKIATADDMSVVKAYLNDLKAGKFVGQPEAPIYDDSIYSDDAMDFFRQRIRPDYAANCDPRRFLLMRKMYEQVRNNDAAMVQCELISPQSADALAAGGAQNAWITIASANVIPEVLLRLCSAIISSRQLHINRANLDSIDNPESSSPELNGNVTMLRLLVSANKEGIDLNPEGEFMSILRRDLKRAKWLDNETTDLGLHKFPSLGLDRAEVITALCSMIHGPLYKQNSQAYASIKSIIQLINSNPKIIGMAEEIASLFLQRFNPAGSISDEVFAAKYKELYEKIQVLHFDAAEVALTKMLEVVQSVLRTNFFSEDRYALSMRVKPTIMVSNPAAVMPFGVFFIHGRHFNAFHCRFRDIARGGLRIVTPQNSDQFALESSRQFDEAYSLSYAQQLKNKDIPEGGAKGVILVNTPSIEVNKRFFAMRKAVKGFADSMLDLIVKDSITNLVDLYGKEELIYLGPDEQIIPSDIDWITQRAGERGYPIPAAFMSSKKDAGFNHKEFGVTSEGIVVYLDVALRQALHINPKTDNFTIKLTGGPDGDVAGNLIRILFRDYRDTCKVVGIADGFGVAEDPNGLDPDELLRLVAESLPISSYSKDKLSATGVAMSANSDEGAIRRNSMHFRVKSDAFIPAGGRPNTINSDNWHLFLDENKKPSSPLIVEGANIFITADARTKLFENGKVAIVKDSSANKCGVITSSCEVAASMLLSKEEFMSIKQELVQDVLHNLRNLARLEGELLFREYKNYPGQLPQFSERISFAIAKVTDAITDALADVQPEDALFKELLPLIRDNLPKKLADVAGLWLLANKCVEFAALPREPTRS
mmetsp:Transcript_3860/g.5309  ORF Transcript_3860/g.5309 Transcript_3860/m.5309 type:complete len:1017 (-) Transcript_3860:1740-4790(-)